MCLGLLLIATACQPEVQTSGDGPADILAFVARKEAQAKQIQNASGITVAPDIWRYFEAAKKGDYPAVAGLWETLSKRAGQYEGSRADLALTSEVWQTVIETPLATERF